MRVVFFGMLVLGVWALWFWTARVKMYAMSPQATLHIQRAIYPLEVGQTGILKLHALKLGKRFKKGDLLLQLDATTLQLKRKQVEAQLTTITSKIATLKSQIKAEKRARYRASGAYRVAIREARLQSRSAGAQASNREAHRKRMARLIRKGVIAKANYLDAKTNAQTAKATAERLKLQVSRLKLQHQQEQNRSQSTLAALQRDLTSLEGESKITKALLAQHLHELKQYQIRAPRDGHIGTVQELQPGQQLTKGTRVGVFIAQGTIRIRAQFPPSEALGRIKRGQRGMMRLKGFSWVQYGGLPIVVSDVASIPIKNSILVECNLLPSQSSIPLKHGMPGSIEIILERITPATLFLRSAGQLIERQTQRKQGQP